MAGFSADWLGSVAGLAQLVEQRIRNAKVVGSTPISGTIFYPTPFLFVTAQPDDWGGIL